MPLGSSWVKYTQVYHQKGEEPFIIEEEAGLAQGLSIRNIKATVQVWF